MNINILLADTYGFCFGVKRAVELTEETLAKEKSVYIDGMLIHNEDEVSRLSSLGLKELDSSIQDGDTLILRTHGSPVEKKEAYENKYKVIDTVCPYVQRVHKIVKENCDKKVVIFGKKNHAEVIGINSNINYKGIVIETEKDLNNNLNNFNNLADEIVIVCQTTFKESTADKFLKILDENKINYNFFNTICSATRKRSSAVIDLAKKCDCLIILGDKKSSNCTKLYEYAKIYCDQVYFINRISEIDIFEIMLYNNIGIIAGASTPDWIIKEAIEKMEDMNKNEMMEAIESSFTRIKRGDILKGTVLYVNDSEITVNINYRADGIINRDEVSDDPTISPSDLFKAGDEIEVYVLKMDDGDGNVLLSHKRVQRLKNWDVVEEKFNNEEIVDAIVNEVTKGGLKCEVEGLNAFMPASQVSIGYKKDLSVFLDEVLASKIIDFNKDKRRIILSRKVVEQKELDALKEEIYSKIHVGDVIEGTVQRLTNFGAFVDIGGIDGLIHISQLSWQRVKHPSDVVQPNQKIEVQVLDIDPENDRIALGLKQLTKEPWEVFVENNKVGDIIKGKIVNLLDFGAFVKLDSGVDGLLHVSQIAREHVEKPSDKLEIGQDVEVMITEIDEENKKISLSIKEIERKKAREARAKEKAEKSEQVENTTEEKVSSTTTNEVVKEDMPKKEKVENVEKQQEDNSFGINLADLLNKEDFDA
ncbi:bifunctional 4-hydroxy-3-methylbut-2-enyl diphosphate reductase/30S ribosomal protein S1 [Neofamilia massiliensis]|uniref:bifunctional 4-hydroxy-3-methylbut-2-enyl diphosphate reductase/30S ribosomal protein S1 n=1 Tax=Neofamilia massiliensis TaxID=1673724 RepID=UPI0009E72F47|nr:bifunctional 4-hydroxy-3-methylbut-2-enyl diphosphate reductase/30S ribosomal protein S1 [Neofamilia massiliensis]